MLKVVVPPASAPVPRVAVPSLKVTVPVRFAVPVAGVTVAVKVTDCPRRDGLLLEARAVVVALAGVPFTKVTDTTAGSDTIPDLSWAMAVNVCVPETFLVGQVKE